MAKLSVKYSDLQHLIGPYAMTQRTESRQFLAWFLNHYYRLEEGDVDDCICDGHDDKTVDGIWVSEQSSQIHIFQSRIVKGPKTLGDVALKEFYGSLSQFSDRQCIEQLAGTTKNKELAGLLRDQEIAEKVEKGYIIRGVFVTNAPRDHNAVAYLKVAPKLLLYDELELERKYIPDGKSDPIAAEVTFDVSNVPILEYPISSTLKMAIAPVSAMELLKMNGIKNGELFAYNVRQWLVKTKVNDDIAASIKDQEEHKLFPAFHNGVTILCEKLRVSKDKIKISGYAVVNGCQSLSGLYDNKTKVSSDLHIMTKIIQTPPDGKLAAKITDHTNNQNGTTARDLQSNNLIQTRLQGEINGKGEYCYRIKRGEHPDWNDNRVIENDLAAGILLAFDLKEPWSCHQTYKLFDELHARIFARLEVNGDRVVTLYRIYETVMSKLPLIENQLFARYRLTRFFLLYLLRQALEADEAGRKFCANPSLFTSTKKDQARLMATIDKMAQAIARIISGEARRRDADVETPFDFKRELKSPKAVRTLENAVITTYKILADNDAAITFGEGWKAAGMKSAQGKA
jgi:AIPR protein